jgi:hypothetical protein
MILIDDMYIILESNYLIHETALYTKDEAEEKLLILNKDLALPIYKIISLSRYLDELDREW